MGGQKQLHKKTQKIQKPKAGHGPIKNSRPRYRPPLYLKNYLPAVDLKKMVDYLCSLNPIWEERYSEHRPPPQGEEQRRLLRPVYWLGNWQFACLGYFHPPKGVHHRSVDAEKYPVWLSQLVKKIEAQTRKFYSPQDIPKGWHLNTLLINYYGDEFVDGKKQDLARVGEHQDYEPGPVASLSFGERGLFQFVDGKKRFPRPVVYELWTEDNSLLVFGQDQWKKHTFHRVQRVERKKGVEFPVAVENFKVRRINLTFRYVPDEFILPLSKLPLPLQLDIRTYVEELARHSEFWQKQLTGK